MGLEDSLLDSLPKHVKEFFESKQKWIAEATKSPTKLPPNKRIFCNWCSHETNHICKYDYCFYEMPGDPSTHIYIFTMGYRLWMCAGCDTHTLERYIGTESFHFDGFVDNDDGKPEVWAVPEVNNEVDSDFFPKRTQYSQTAKQFKQLSARLNGIYQESISAFNNETPMLCTIGIRALIEGICADQEITGSNLGKKIDGLARILPKNIVTSLHNLRFMGNEAAHELTAPSQEELQLAIGICEDLLNYLYELDYKASSLDKIRKRKKSSGNNIASYF